MTTTYKTFDFLDDLSQSQMNSARTFTFEPYVPVLNVSNSLLGWDYGAGFYTSEDYAILRDEFVFDGKEGATYDIFSYSFFDPFVLLLYDNFGNVIATDENEGTYGSDMIFNFVAPYTGKYYIDASWYQGFADAHKFVSVSVYEDVDTIPSPPSPPVEPESATLINPVPVDVAPQTDNDIDRIFNWGESIYFNLFPEHHDSLDVFGYYARLYSNGDALGEQNGNIYYYDGGADGTGNITLIGAISDFLPQVEATGF